MRSIIKMLGLAFFATLAFSAVGALGAGSASALLFLTQSTKELFTVKSLTTAKLETALNAVECATVLGHGLILNKTDIAHTILLTFHECKVAGTTAACTGTSNANEPSGLITTLELDALLVTLLPSTADKYGLKVLAEKGNLAEFKCATVPETNVTVKGSVVGEFAETLTESETAKAEAKLVFAKGANAGEAKIKDYETLNGVGAAKLESSFTGIFEESNQQGTGDVIPLHPVTLCHN
jgi:hypothetical protein